MLTFLLWYLAITLLGWLAFPLIYTFFRRLPDRGYAFAKPLGLLFFGYLFWFLGSLGLLHNDLGGLLFCLLLLAALAVLQARKIGPDRLLVWLRESWKYLLAVELFFLVTFAAWTIIRSYNPAILGTEKPMEFMFLNSVLRSPRFPPQDAWLSGHAISYYYFGYILIACMARLTGTAASVAFNLGLALLFALAATGALGLLVNLIATVKSGPEPARKPQETNLLSAFWPGLLGPLMVLLVGNFYGVLEFAHDNGLLANLRIPAVWYDFGQAENPNQVQALGEFIQPPGIQTGMVNIWQWLDLKQLNEPQSFENSGVAWNLDNWFFAARVIHDRNLIGVETEAIDEMPAFSFVLGDLHPHVLALPFVILAIGLAFDWLLWAREAASRAPPGDISWLERERLLFSGLVLGALAFLNTWDFPIYWFLTVGALVLGLGSIGGWNLLLKRWRYLGKLALSFLFLGLALYFPFYLTFQSQAGGILPNLIYPTRFQQTVVMFGPPLFGACLFLGWAILRWRSLVSWRAALVSGLGIVLLLALFVFILVAVMSRIPEAMGLVDQFIFPLARQQAIKLILQRRLVDSLATIVPAGMIGLAVGLMAGVIRSGPVVQAGETLSHNRPEERRFQVGTAAHPQSPYNSSRSPAVLMVLLMTLTGALLLLVPEFLYLRDNFGTRMNTLFKFYFQTWVLWALVFAFGAWYLIVNARRWVRWFTLASVSAVIFLGLFYTAGSLEVTVGRFNAPPTLNGMAYFARSYPDDWAAIQWLQDNVKGAPVILEGTRGAYWLDGPSSRISMATGLPTLMGWDNHERQWRGPYFGQVEQRLDDIRTIYQARDWHTTQTLLEEYDVEYVIAGALEQDWYHPIYAQKFEQFMQPVLHSGNLTIYRSRR
jgi:YYY domain-containing protein